MKKSVFTEENRKQAIVSVEFALALPLFINRQCQDYKLSTRSEGEIFPYNMLSYLKVYRFDQILYKLQLLKFKINVQSKPIVVHNTAEEPSLCLLKSVSSDLSHVCKAQGSHDFS